LALAEREENLMKAVEYLGRVLANGQLEIPLTARQELGLHPEMQVRVILLQNEAEGQASDEAERARRRHEAIEELLALRTEFASMDFSLTEELVRVRELEDVLGTRRSEPRGQPRRARTQLA
jgi:hypothetical protein